MSRAMDLRGIMGCQFLVQSDKRGTEYIIHQFNVFLYEQREIIKNITDDEFKIKVNAVLATL